MTLPPEPQAGRLAREQLAALKPTLPEESFEDVRLLVTELVTNAVKHAGLEPNESVELETRYQSGRLEVMMRYPEHRGFDATLTLEPDETSGYGLVLVDRIADHWSIVKTKGFLEAWFELRFPEGSA